MEQRVIVTGINGFVGEHVAREFNNRNLAVTGFGHDTNPEAKVRDIIDTYIACDLLNEADLREKLDLGDVEAIIHLAGLAAVGQSFDQPKRFMINNGAMTINLLQLALEREFKGRIVVVSTGALYDPRQTSPLKEESPTSASSPYAVGKMFVEDIVDYYRSRGLDAVTVRPFNHLGPGQGPGFILPDLYDQLIKAESTHQIKVGNIETRRDYTDVRDITRAYGIIALASSLKYSLYNICSGRSLAGKELLQFLQDELKINNLSIEIDESKIRPNDIPEIVGDPSRLREELGWEPEIPIKQTVRDFVDSRHASKT